ncbi:hypothetical protein [Teredinibacter haidensis]|uniref:hypothetical protein n=1 Tax=Teredinibacter haidensis TaxID=2731755 RepID=UPI00111529A1|nr:hypothetical protein [Teredinibacter haidensis]
MNKYYLISVLGLLLVCSVMVGQVSAERAHSQKPGAAVRLVNPAPVTVMADENRLLTIQFETPLSTDVLVIQLRSAEGVNILSTTRAWQFKRGEKPFIKLDITAGSESGHYAVMFDVTTIREAAGRTLSASRILGLGVIVQADTAQSTATRKASKPKRNVKTLPNGTKVRWMEAQNPK